MANIVRVNGRLLEHFLFRSGDAAERRFRADLHLSCETQRAAWWRAAPGRAELHAINFCQVPAPCWHFIYSSLVRFALKSMAGTWRKGKSPLTGGSSESKWKPGFYFFSLKYAEWATGRMGGVRVERSSSIRLENFLFASFHTNAAWKPAMSWIRAEKLAK